MRFFNSFLIFCIAGLVSFSSLHAKELAITFDDSPRHASGYFDGPTRAKILVENLKRHNVDQVAFFSVSSRLDQEGVERLKYYAKAGHIIANHTHTHPNFNEISLQEFTNEFLKANKALEQFSTFERYFRFPFLREGDTKRKRDGARHLLEKHQYKNAYITLNNYDWYIEVLFQNAIKKYGTIDLARASQFYVSTLIQSIEYYDQMAIEALGRSPKHVLLLHEMDISALFIGDLVDALRHKGWKIIPLKLAYQDDIAAYRIATPLKFNPGRIGEIARDKGKVKGLWHFTLDEKYLQTEFERQVLATPNSAESNTP